MVNASLTLELLSVGFLLIIVTILILRSNKISIAYAIIWMLPAVSIILLALVPQLFEIVANFLGFQTISNLVIGFMLVLIIFLIMSLTIIITNQNKKITLLIQEISLLKKRLEDTRRIIDEKE